MCIKHDVGLLKEWLPKKSFQAYKVISRDNTSIYDNDFVWKVGSVSCSVEPLKVHTYKTFRYRQTGTGIYVFLDRNQAVMVKELYEHAKGVCVNVDPKVVCVYVYPEDVIYSGYSHYHGNAGNGVSGIKCDTFVCRRVEVKSLRGLK